MVDVVVDFKPVSQLKAKLLLEIGVRIGVEPVICDLRAKMYFIL